MSAVMYSGIKSTSILQSEPESNSAPLQIPRLLLPSAVHSKSLNTYDALDSKTTRSEFKLPESIRGGTVCGSSKGWLFIAKNYDFFMYNPSTGDRHELPSLFTLPYFHHLSFLEVDGQGVEEFFHHPFYSKEGALDFYDPQTKVSTFINQIELSSQHPSHSDCVVAAILDFSSVLVCCRPNDKKWTVLYGFYDGCKNNKVHALVYFNCIAFCYKTLFVSSRISCFVLAGPARCIVARACSIRLGTVPGDEYTLRLKFLPEFYFHDPTRYNPLISTNVKVDQNRVIKTYMMESNSKNGELIMVHKYMKAAYQCGQAEEDIDYLKTRRFNVFKLTPSSNDTTGNSFSVQQIKDLGDDGVMFVGGSSTAIHAAKQSTTAARGNCIYFIDEQSYYSSRVDGKRCIRSCDYTGVFYLDDEKIHRPFPCVQIHRSSRMYWFQPGIFNLTVADKIWQTLIRCFNFSSFFP